MLAMTPIVAYDQLWLPAGLAPDAGKDEEVTDEMLRGKLAFAREQHLGLDLYLTDRVRRFYEANEYRGTPLVTLQAFAMHRWFPLAASRADRAAGVTYVQETLEAAGALGVPRIVAACAFKTDVAPLAVEDAAAAMDLCTAFFRQEEILATARAQAVHIMVEVLSTQKHPAALRLHQPETLVDLLGALNARDERLFTMLIDTGHLLDTLSQGDDVAGIAADADVLGTAAGRGDVLTAIVERVAAMGAPVEELQLRDAGGRHPPPAWVTAGHVRTWVEMLAPAVVCVEYRQTVPKETCTAFLTALRE
jgi:sugar phosphate isomerase/epimerase